MMDGAAEEGSERGVIGEGKGLDMVSSVYEGGSSDLGTTCTRMNVVASMTSTVRLHRRWRARKR